MGSTGTSSRMRADDVECFTFRCLSTLWQRWKVAPVFPKRAPSVVQRSLVPDTSDAKPQTIVPEDVANRRVRLPQQAVENGHMQNGAMGAKHPEDECLLQTPGGSPRSLERLVPGFPIYHLSLHDGDCREGLIDFYNICLRAKDLMVTTSCFANWKSGGCTNAFGKVIPAPPVRTASPRIFFFDDNINLHLGKKCGAPDAKGICNLRDISTNEYVEFSEGSNGFMCERSHRHTLVHHSSLYQVVLVQASILDAVLDEEYFSSIISKYKQDGEDIIVFMDVNGTILSSDTIMELDSKQLLLNTLCGFVEVRPRAPCRIIFQGRAIELEKPVMLKQLILDHNTNGAEKSRQSAAERSKTFTREWLEKLLLKLSEVADLGWYQKEGGVQPSEFLEALDGHMACLAEHDDNANGSSPSSSGLTRSWMRCVQSLRQEKQTIVLNSFGVDAHRVLVHSRPDHECALHLAVNSELWSERDRTQFHQQLQAAAMMM